MDDRGTAGVVDRIERMMDDARAERYHWSEAFMLAVGEHLLGHVDDQAQRMMTGIAGGLGGSHEEMCGALNAGALLVGALHGRTRPDEPDETCYALASAYRTRFLQEWGTTRCADLRAQGYGSEGTIPCAKLVSRAAVLFLEILDERPN